MLMGPFFCRKNDISLFIRTNLMDFKIQCENSLFVVSKLVDMFQKIFSVRCHDFLQIISQFWSMFQLLERKGHHLFSFQSATIVSLNQLFNQSNC